MKKTDFKVIVASAVNTSIMTLPAIVVGYNYQSLTDTFSSPLTVRLLTETCGSEVTSKLTNFFENENVYILDNSKPTILGIELNFLKGHGDIYFFDPDKEEDVSHDKFKLDSHKLIERFMVNDGAIKRTDLIHRILFEAGHRKDEIRYELFEKTIDADNLFAAMLNHAIFRQELLEPSTIEKAGIVGNDYKQLLGFMASRLEQVKK